MGRALVFSVPCGERRCPSLQFSSVAARGNKGGLKISTFSRFLHRGGCFFRVHWATDPDRRAMQRPKKSSIAILLDGFPTFLRVKSIVQPSGVFSRSFFLLTRLRLAGGVQIIPRRRWATLRYIGTNAVFAHREKRLRARLSVRLPLLSSATPKITVRGVGLLR